MTEGPAGNIIELLEAEKLAEAKSQLCAPRLVRAAVGPRSARAALEAATRLFGGDLDETARWMTTPSAHLGATPRECAERSDEQLECVLRFIVQLEAGVYV